ncbi:MAG TPA: ABC transporter substrate-binding protein [Jatrophihabitantaceae bacterium]|nr:ABC transporter substrate-binding protein [Jatrophihabitantaceae bacterium]
MRVRPQRRLAIVAGAVAVAALVAACSSSKNDNGSNNTGGASGGSGSKTESVQVMMFPGQAYRLPVLIADKQGFFAKHGIKISIVAQPNNLQGAQAMTATKSDVGQLSTPTLAQGVENHAPVAFFCGGINYLQTSLIAKNGSSFTPGTGNDVIKQLSGKKVGVQTPVGSGLQLLFAAALKDAGVKNVTYVNVGGGNNITLAALDKGSVDVAQVNPPGLQAITVAKSAKVLTYLPASGGPDAYQLYGSAWTGQTSWLKAHPDTAKGFCSAIGEALDYIKSNTDAAATVLADDTKSPPAIAQEVVKTVYADFSTDLPKDTLQKTFDFYKQIGITKTDLDYNTLVQPAS